MFFYNKLETIMKDTAINFMWMPNVINSFILQSKYTGLFVSGIIL